MGREGCSYLEGYSVVFIGIRDFDEVAEVDFGLWFRLSRNRSLVDVTVKAGTVVILIFHLQKDLERKFQIQTDPQNKILIFLDYLESIFSPYDSPAFDDGQSVKALLFTIQGNLNTEKSFITGKKHL